MDYLKSDFSKSTIEEIYHLQVSILKWQRLTMILEMKMKTSLQTNSSLVIKRKLSSLKIHLNKKH